MKRILCLSFLFLLFASNLYAGWGTPSEFDNVIAKPYTDNSANDMLVRTSGIKIEKIITVTGTGSVVSNVLQLTGTVLILDQWAEITSVTTLVNLTGLYATAYDGTNSVELTDDGAVLSGAPVGSFFTKDKVATEIYSVNLSDQVRVLETLGDRKAGRPFIVTQKNGTDTFIRLHYTTTDSPVSFTVRVFFEYIPLNGGTLEFL